MLNRKNRKNICPVKIFLKSFSEQKFINMFSYNVILILFLYLETYPVGTQTGSPTYVRPRNYGMVIPIL